MTTPSPDSEQPSSLIHSAIIADFESQPHTNDELYSGLMDADPELAMWFRQRATNTSPELRERGPAARLALEMAHLFIARLEKQGQVVANIASLEQAFELELLPETHTDAA